MTTQDLQNKIKTLKEAWTNFGNTDFKMTGISIIRQNSSDNWLFNTDVDINEVVPVVLKSLEKEIIQLEEILTPILEQEAKEKAAQEEADRIAEEQRILAEQEAAEVQAKRDERLQKQRLGAVVMEEYLFDNSELTLTSAQTLQQLKKFASIKQLLELGSIRVAKELIAVSEVDDVFTQERKKKY
jgi:hypothetical protein